MMNIAQEKSYQTDEELMLEFKQGNQQAFTQLYHRYNQLVFAYIIKNTGSHQAIASDISQEVWRSIIHAAINYETTSSFKTYLFKIIGNKIVDYYRNNRKNPMHQALNIEAPEFNAWSEENVSQDQYAQQNPEDIYIQQSEISQLNTALQCLPAHHRQILLQYYGLEMSLTDIADEMNVSLECAKSRLRYAKQQLGRILKVE